MAETETIGHKAIKGTIWASIDRFSTIGVQFFVNLVLARLLMPSDFGAIGMLTIFIGVSQVIIDGGFVSALIQKKDPDQKDYSTIFYWNISIATALYLLLFIAAPYISDFYRMPILCNVLRAIGLWIIVFSINVVQTARLRKKLAFKSIAITNLSAIIASGMLGIALAYLGYGIWSLVIQQISYGLTTTIVYFIITRWHPSAEFSAKSLKSLFDFGGYMFIATILQEICRNFQGIIIGRRFSATDMGYYTQAQRLDMVTSNALPLVISQVMFPVFSSLQNDKNRLIEIVTTNIRIISFCIFPLMGALILSASQIITILYGDKWLPCALYFQILCIGGLFSCLQNVNYFAVAAVGKSKQLFWWSIYKWGFLLLAMLIAMNFGIIALIWSISISALNIYMTNAWLVSRHVGLPLFRQIKILAPPLITTAIGTTVGFITIKTLYINEIIAAIISLIIAIGINIIFKTKGFRILKTIISRLYH